MFFNPVWEYCLFNATDEVGVNYHLSLRDDEPYWTWYDLSSGIRDTLLCTAYGWLETSFAQERYIGKQSQFFHWHELEYIFFTTGTYKDIPIFKKGMRSYSYRCCLRAVLYGQP